MGSSIRLAFGLPVAAVVTVALFLLMRYLVLTDFQLPDEGEAVAQFSITRQIEEEDPNSRLNERLQRPDKVEQPPPPPPPQQQKSATPNLEGAGGALPDFSGAFNLQGGFNPDRDAQPLVRIPPRYPERALSRGVEGWVLVQFNVTPEGEVVNAEIIDGEPPGMFDRAAIRAVENWKYQPKIVDGKPAPRFGVQTVFTFKLDQ